MELTKRATNGVLCSDQGPIDALDLPANPSLTQPAQTKVKIWTFWRSRTYISENDLINTMILGQEPTLKMGSVNFHFLTPEQYRTYYMAEYTKSREGDISREYASRLFVDAGVIFHVKRDQFHFDQDQQDKDEHMEAIYRNPNVSPQMKLELWPNHEIELAEITKRNRLREEQFERFRLNELEWLKQTQIKQARMNLELATIKQLPEKWIFLEGALFNLDHLALGLQECETRDREVPKDSIMASIWIEKTKLN